MTIRISARGKISNWISENGEMGSVKVNGLDFDHAVAQALRAAVGTEEVFGTVSVTIGVIESLDFVTTREH